MNPREAKLTWEDVMREITETDPADTSDTSNIFITYNDLAAILKATFQVVDGQNEAITALQEELAAPEQEPVAWRHKRLGRIETAESFALPYNWGDKSEWEPLYEHPPVQQEPLSSHDIERMWLWVATKTPGTLPVHEFARAIEDAIRSKT